MENGTDAHALSAHIDRIEGLTAERKRTDATIKTAYKQAEAEGIDRRALKAIIKERSENLENNARLRVQVERMRKALASLHGTPLGEWATAALAEHVSARKRGNAHAEA
jgi:uncharacterized protein (UPF0335 family)